MQKGGKEVIYFEQKEEKAKHAYHQLVAARKMIQKHLKKREYNNAGERLDILEGDTKLYAALTLWNWLSDSEQDLIDLWRALGIRVKGIPQELTC